MLYLVLYFSEISLFSTPNDVFLYSIFKTLRHKNTSLAVKRYSISDGENGAREFAGAGG